MKTIDDAIFEVEGQVITTSNAIDPSLIGANASAEGGDEDVADTTEKVINIVHAGGFQQIPMDKESFTKYLKVAFYCAISIVLDFC